MYKGYHFSMANELLPHYFLRAEEYKRIGRAQKEVAQKVIQEKILSGKWVIAGDKTESEWFPQLQPLGAVIEDWQNVFMRSLSEDTQILLRNRIHS